MTRLGPVCVLLPVLLGACQQSPKASLASLAIAGRNDHHRVHVEPIRLSTAAGRLRRAWQPIFPLAMRSRSAHGQCQKLPHTQ
jgi:hypothetical protein